MRKENGRGEEGGFVTKYIIKMKKKEIVLEWHLEYFHHY